MGTRPRTLQALMKGSYVVPKLTIVTIGSKPPIAAFEVCTPRFQHGYLRSHWQWLCTKYAGSRACSPCCHEVADWYHSLTLVCRLRNTHSGAPSPWCPTLRSRSRAGSPGEG